MPPQKPTQPQVPRKVEGMMDVLKEIKEQNQNGPAATSTPAHTSSPAYSAPRQSEPRASARFSGKREWTLREKILTGTTVGLIGLFGGYNIFFSGDGKPKPLPVWQTPQTTSVVSQHSLEAKKLKSAYESVKSIVNRLGNESDDQYNLRLAQYTFAYLMANENKATLNNGIAKMRQWKKGELLEDLPGYAAMVLIHGDDDLMSTLDLAGYNSGINLIDSGTIDGVSAHFPFIALLKKQNPGITEKDLKSRIEVILKEVDNNLHPASGIERGGYAAAYALMQNKDSKQALEEIIQARELGRGTIYSINTGRPNRDYAGEELGWHTASAIAVKR